MDSAEIPELDYPEVWEQPNEENADAIKGYGCERCGECCRYHGRHAAYVSWIDIMKIRLKTGMHEEEFVQRLASDKVIRAVGRREGDERDGPYCMFHTFDDSMMSSCGIHGWSKPLVCMAFPGYYACVNGHRKNGLLNRLVSEIAPYIPFL